MADWGDIFSGVIDVIQGQPYGGYGGSQTFAPPVNVPTTVTPTPINPVTGKPICKRRRRRRLLDRKSVV